MNDNYSAMLRAVTSAEAIKAVFFFFFSVSLCILYLVNK